MKRKTIRSTHFWQLLVATLLLESCTVGPRYSPPQMNIPEEWHTPLSNGMSPTSMSPAIPDCLLWWESLNDPTLNSLMQRAAEQNLDLFIAETRILEARLMRKGKEAEMYPHIDGSLTGGHLYCSKDILKNGILGQSTSHKRNMNFFEAGFDAEWEIDLFGYQKHQVNAADAKIEAAEASLADLWVSLSAEIARNYIELRGFQKRRHLLHKNIEELRDTIHLTKELLSIGVVSRIDLLGSEEKLSQLMTQMPTLNYSIDQAIHRLSVLLGHPPGELYDELTPSGDLPLLPCEKPISLPSELLRRRPDIRKAERDLAAATEDVGTAVAALFPRFSIYGFIGEIGTNLRSMTNSSGLTWFGAPQLLFPIFNSRLLKQDVKFNENQACQALYAYQKIVLGALEEVENAMAAFRHEMEKENRLNQVEELNRDIYQLNVDLYERGIKDYLEVLTANRALLSAEEARLQSQVNLLLDYIALYKALGGG